MPIPKMIIKNIKAVDLSVSKISLYRYHKINKTTWGISHIIGSSEPLKPTTYSETSDA